MSASQSFAHDLLIGKPIAGRYRVVRLLGEGGMGAVYEGAPFDGGPHVAIKVLAAQYAVDDVAARRFMHEAEAAAKIAHKNIAYVTEMGREPSGALYIVQELLQGEDLRTILQRRGTLTVGEAIAAMIPIADALHAAHEHGILHRDVKPENIYLTIEDRKDVRPKLIDFGISKFQDSKLDNDKRTQTGVAIGTPDYMSPEQARADKVLDARTDQWSLACVLYELLTGRPPFVATTATLVLTKIITEDPPRIELFLPDISVAVAQVVHRALDTDRSKRYASMAEFGAALEKAAAGASIELRLPETLHPDEQHARASLEAEARDDEHRHHARVTSAEVPSPSVARAPSTADGAFEGPTTLYANPPPSPDLMPERVSFAAPQRASAVGAPIAPAEAPSSKAPTASIIVQDAAYTTQKVSTPNAQRPSSITAPHQAISTQTATKVLADRASLQPPLDDDEFVDPSRGTRLKAAVFVLVVLGVIAAVGWYIYSEKVKQDALRDSIAASGGSPSTPAPTHHQSAQPTSTHSAVDRRPNTNTAPRGETRTSPARVDHVNDLQNPYVTAPPPTPRVTPRVRRLRPLRRP